MKRRLAVLGLLLLAAGCATAPPGEQVALRTECPGTSAAEPEAPLPERTNRWWWGAAEPGRMALRSSFGLDGCPPVLQ